MKTMKPIQDKLCEIDNIVQRCYMLGDVVMYNGKPIIIASLTIYSQGLTQYVNYPNGQKLKFVDSTKVEPILLTEKILEANGFAYEKTKNAWRYGVSFHLVKGSYTWDGFWVRDSRINVRYVHELQHIMRLCDKEFEAMGVKLKTERKCKK